MNLQKSVCSLAAVSVSAAAILAGNVIQIPAAYAKSPINVVSNPRTTVVPYADLNLATKEGEATLMSRVGGAVRFVCEGPKWGPRTEYSGCRLFAWRGARPQIALAVRRAQEIAANGRSDIPAVVLAFAGSR